MPQPPGSIVVPLLSRPQTGVHMDTYAMVFTAALLTIAMVDTVRARANRGIDREDAIYRVLCVYACAHNDSTLRENAILLQAAVCSNPECLLEEKDTQAPEHKTYSLSPSS